MLDGEVFLQMNAQWTPAVSHDTNDIILVVWGCDHCENTPDNSRIISKKLYTKYQLCACLAWCILEMNLQWTPAVSREYNNVILAL